MRMLLPAALVCLALPARAQEPPEPAPKADVFGGYSYLGAEDDSLHGFAVGFSYRVFGPVAFAVDVSGHYGGSGGVDLTRYFFTGGPRASFLRGKPASVFVHALFGLARSTASIGVLGVTISETEQDLGMLFGGGVDIRIGKSLAARVQGDYERVQFESGSESGYRLSAGVVYRFGGK